MANSYLPSSDTDRVVWLNNFKTKMQQYGPSLGFTAAEITGIVNDANMYQYIITLKDGCKQAAQSLTQLGKLLRSAPSQSAMGAIPSLPVAGTPPASVQTGIFNRVAVAVARIKLQSTYTTAMGTDLGIIAPASSFNPATAQPVLTVKLQAGYPLLKWRKGEADGIHLYVDRQDGNGFISLDKLMRNEYIDIAPLPANTNVATWEYKARFLINDDEIGVFSAPVSITVFRV